MARMSKNDAETTPANNAPATAKRTKHQSRVLLNRLFPNGVVASPIGNAELHDDDVLLGRGAALNRYIGNIRFRDLVRAKTPEYVTHTRRLMKDRIAREIVQQVKACHGRFLRRVVVTEAALFEKSANNANDEWWILVDDEVALEKVKQAFRDEHNKPTKPEAVTIPPSKKRKQSAFSPAAVDARPETLTAGSPTATSHVPPPYPLPPLVTPSFVPPALQLPFNAPRVSNPMTLSHDPSMTLPILLAQQQGLPNFPFADYNTTALYDMQLEAALHRQKLASLLMLHQQQQQHQMLLELTLQQAQEQQLSGKKHKLGDDTKQRNDF